MRTVFAATIAVLMIATVAVAAEGPVFSLGTMSWEFTEALAPVPPVPVPPGSWTAANPLVLSGPIVRALKEEAAREDAVKRAKLADEARVLTALFSTPGGI